MRLVLSQLVPFGSGDAVEIVDHQPVADSEFASEALVSCQSRPKNIDKTEGALLDAQYGYVCDGADRTTRTAGPFIESATTTTGFTLTVVTTSSVANDILQWKCIGY